MVLLRFSEAVALCSTNHTRSLLSHQAAKRDRSTGGGGAQLDEGVSGVARLGIEEGELSGELGCGWTGFGLAVGGHVGEPGVNKWGCGPSFNLPNRQQFISPLKQCLHQCPSPVSLRAPPPAPAGFSSMVARTSLPLLHFSGL